jgi:translocation and assembly module TamB
MKTQLQGDLRASGVRSSHGEPFDGNAALVIDMGDRSVEGRADILRIGPRHLLDLLDLQDPHRANAGMNRIRSALDLGYPERVRISFKHGFASAGVTFGGLASLVSVDDLRGIPIGPLMERVVRSLELREEP